MGITTADPSEERLVPRKKVHPENTKARPVAAPF